MIKRIFYGSLVILIFVSIVMLDVMISRMMVEPLDVTALGPNGVSIDQQIGAFGRTPWGRLLARGSVIPLGIALLVLIATKELVHLVQLKGARPFVRLATCFVFLTLLSPWFSAAGWFGDGAADVEGIKWQVTFLAAAGIAAALCAVLYGRTQDVIRDISATTFIVFYLGFLPSFAIQIRCSVNNPGHEGAWLLVILGLVIKSSDIGGYLLGSLIGRHKVAPKISPGKTWEGLLGGIIVSVGVAIGFCLLGRYAPGASSEPTTGLLARLMDLLSEIGAPLNQIANSAGWNWMILATVLGLIMAPIALVGDLLESTFKRDAGVKDTGQVIPTFGGILDLVDSLILAMPVAWFLLTAVWQVL